MSSFVVTMTGDEASLWKAMQKVAQGTDKVKKGFKGVKDEATRSKQATAQWGREAEKWLSKIRTPQETHNRNVAQLNTLLRTGHLNQAQYGRAVAQSTDEMKRAENVGKRAFGSQALSQIRSMAAGYLSVGAAIALATRAMMEMDAERQRIADKQRESEMGMASLAQLATTPDEMRSLVAAAKQTYAEGGAMSLDEAGRVVFSIKSAGGMEFRELFSQLKATGLVEQPDVMARAAATMIASMGQQETGNMRDLVSKAFGASEFSPSSAEELLEAAASSGGSAKAIGFRDEEVLAATALVATARGGAEEGGTYLAQMMRTLDEKQEFRGKSLRESIQMIQAKGLEGEALKKWFGRAQGLAAYRVLGDNLTKYDEALRTVEQAQATDRVSAQLELPAAIPELKAAATRRKKSAGAELAGEELGIQRNLLDATMEDYARAVREGEYDTWLPAELDIALSRMSLWGNRKLSGDEAMLRGARARGQVFDPDLRADIDKSIGPDAARGPDLVRLGAGSEGGGVPASTAAKLEAAATALQQTVAIMERFGMQVPPTLAHPDEDR